jgi:cytidine deaminase
MKTPSVIELSAEKNSPQWRSALLEYARIAQSLAVHPISGFAVGAALFADGKVFLGANYEFHNSRIQWTVHAEQSAYHNALVHGITDIEAIAVTATPCGHCRQFFYERCRPSLLIITDELPDMRLTDLLPRAFRLNSVVAEQYAPLPEQYKDDELFQLAYKAYKQSLAPCSGAPMGIAVRYQNNTIVQGVYCESHAFNPSLSAAAAVLSQARFHECQLPIADVAIIASVNDPLNQLADSLEFFRTVQCPVRYIEV